MIRFRKLSFAICIICLAMQFGLAACQSLLKDYRVDAANADRQELIIKEHAYGIGALEVVKTTKPTRGYRSIDLTAENEIIVIKFNPSTNFKRVSAVLKSDIASTTALREDAYDDVFHDREKRFEWKYSQCGSPALTKGKRYYLEIVASSDERSEPLIYARFIIL